MIYISVLFGLYVLLSGAYIFDMERRNRRERERLEDRFMALTNQPALVTHKALADPEPAKVGYVDEDREFQLEKNGHVELLTDED